MLNYVPVHGPRLCSAPFRKSYTLRCVRGTVTDADCVAGAP